MLYLVRYSFLCGFVCFRVLILISFVRQWYREVPVLRGSCTLEENSDVSQLLASQQAAKARGRAVSGQYPALLPL